MFPTFYISGGGYLFLTSNVYPIIAYENVTANIAFDNGVERDRLLDNVSANIAFSYGTLHTILLAYANNQLDNNVTANIEFANGTLTRILVSYDNYPRENVSANISFVSGTLS